MSDSEDGTPHLPFELLEMVFIHLTKNHKALATCMLVCRSWAPCARTLLYAHLRIGPLKRRHALRNVANSPRDALHALSDRLLHVQVIEISWPCNLSSLSALLRLTPRVRRLSIWATARQGRSDIMLISADGLRRCSSTGVAQHPLFDVMRLHILAQPMLFLYEGWDYHPGSEQSFIDLLRLFGDIYHMFLDGGFSLYSFHPESFLELDSTHVRHLSLGQHFIFSRQASELFVRMLYRRVASVYARTSRCRMFLAVLMRRTGGARELQALRLMYGEQAAFFSAHSASASDPLAID